MAGGIPLAFMQEDFLVLRLVILLLTVMIVPFGTN